MPPEPDRRSNIEPEENLTSSHGPHAPQRDKTHQYKPSPGENNNRNDPAAPGGPVNIGVKGGAPDDSGPEAAGQAEDKATGLGKKDSTAGLAQE
jgi:hypothetical protein